MTWLEMLFVGGTTFVILGLLLLAALVYQRALGIVPGGTVSTVSGGSAPITTLPSVPTAPVTLRHTAIRQAEHRYRMERIAAKRRSPNSRTAEQPNTGTPGQRDIMAFRPLTPDAQQLALLAMRAGWSNEKLYKVFGGTAQKRKAELKVLREQVNEERDVQAFQALAQAVARPEIIVPAAEPIPGTG